MYIKHKKMPAHCCIYKLMFYIYLMKYLFNISEYKAMLIKLLIYHRNIYFIHICVYVYIYIYIYICMYIYIYIYIKITKSTDKNTVKAPDR